MVLLPYVPFSSCLIFSQPQLGSSLPVPPHVPTHNVTGTTANMSSTNMSSDAISFPGWTPPALSSLNFSSNCTEVRAFLQSWFDLSHYKDVGSMPGYEYNVTFWVPATVDATTTATYFREALPSDLQAVASYGEILEWEWLLRDSYTGAVSEFLRLAADLNGTGTDSLPLDIPYYYYVIDAPSRACKKSVCSLGFDWDRLGDVNGPGVRRRPPSMLHFPGS